MKCMMNCRCLALAGGLGMTESGTALVTTNSFSLLDLGEAFPIRERFLVDLEVRNVLDKVYSEMRSSGYVNPGAPRSIGLTVHYVGGN